MQVFDNAVMFESTKQTKQTCICKLLRKAILKLNLECRVRLCISTTLLFASSNRVDDLSIFTTWFTSRQVKKK